MTGTAPAGVDANKAVARRAWEEFVNRARPEVADEVYADRFEFHDPADVFVGRTVDTPARMKELVADFRRAFPDLTYHIEDVVGEGDQVALRWRQTSTHRRPLIPGLPARGEAVDVSGVDWFWIRDGRIVREIAAWDLVRMLRQIGAVPPGGAPVAAPQPAARPGGGDREDVPANKRTARAVFEELLTGTGHTRVEDCYAEHALLIDPGVPAPVEGRRALAAFLGTVRRTFGDLRYEVLDVIGETDRVVVRWRMAGTHTGEGLIPGLAPTGAAFDATGIDWITFDGGRIVEQRSEWDVFRVLVRLGLVPAPG